MRKLAILSLAVILVFGTLSCGPSKKEKESAYERAKQDSITVATSQPELAKDVNLNTNTPKDKKFIKTAEVMFKVNNVWKVTERIEDITAKYGGFVLEDETTKEQFRLLNDEDIIGIWKD